MNEFKKHLGKMAFNEHPFLNSIVLSLENKHIDLSNSKIPESKMEEVLQFCKDYKIIPYIKFEDYKKFNNELEIISNIIITGTKDISTEFLKNHSEISGIQIIDEENHGEWEQEEPYSRENFLLIRQKIDEIKEQVEIPDELDKNREKKIFMQVYTILGKMIDYNNYAVTEEGRKDDDLRITCRN